METLNKRKLIGYKDVLGKRKTNLIIGADRWWRSISGHLCHYHYIKINLINTNYPVSDNNPSCGEGETILYNMTNMEHLT